METLYWHDYETFGRDAMRDYPVQFAGIRTNTKLEVIGKPLVKFCKIPPDSLPHPGACLVNRLSPQMVNEQGLPEAKFASEIHKELIKPGTCSVGYNSAGFDDEFTRFMLYRNLFDPYKHHDSKLGNSRWDLINVVRLIRALRPDGIEWPVKEDGSPTTKLEIVAAANGISHENAHDALSDVMALIDLAKLLREKQPRLYDFAYEHRTKSAALKLMGLSKRRISDAEPVLHISSVYGGERNYLAVVLPVANHPQKRNSVIAYNLLEDPDALLDLTARELREILFTKTEDLPEGVSRPPLHDINVNKCPTVVPIAGLRKADLKRLDIDLKKCYQNMKRIREARDMQFVAQHVYKANFTDSTDPDLMLYGGGFFSDADRATLSLIRNTRPSKIRKNYDFEDDRLPEMVFRYRARNFPHTLNAKEQERWESFRRRRLTQETGDGWLTIDGFKKELDEVRQRDLSRDEKKLLKQLEDYVAGIL